MQSSAKAAARGWKRPWMAVAGAGVVLATAVLVVVWAVGGSGPRDQPDGRTARAIQDRLTVKITESGEVNARESKDVKCLIEGQSTILWVAEEGSVVRKGDTLIEFDPTDVQDRLTSRQSAWRSAKAAYEQAERQYKIQESTNESVLSDASQVIKFSLLDLKKYLGTTLAEQLIEGGGHVSFGSLSTDAALGGEGLQQNRKFQSDIYLAGRELSRAQSKLEWTRKLKDKGYVTGSELEGDELEVQRREAEVEQARTALDLFLKYDFPKTAEQRYTDWREAGREYGRVKERAESELGSAKSKLDEMRDAFQNEERLLAKAKDQVEKAAIRAPQDGMVVYYIGGRRSENVTIEPGTTVRYQQTLIQLPNLSEMVVEAKLHESVVKQVSEGAHVAVTIDAYPDQRLTGKVTKVAVMPDRSLWWLNPDLKTYTTEIALDETPVGLKPGMSAQAEILVAELAQVLQVPVAAVHLDQGYQVVYVKAPGGVATTQRVEVGLSSDQSVEILSGINEGDEVYLYRPPGAAPLDVPEAERVSGPPRRAAGRTPPPAARTETAGAEGVRSNKDRPTASTEPRSALAPAKAEALRRQLENASPEQRAKLIKRLQEMAGKQPPPEGRAGRPQPDRGGENR